MRVPHKYSLLLSFAGRFQKNFVLLFSSFIVVIFLSFVSAPPILAEQTKTPVRFPPKVVAENLNHWSKQIDNFSMKWDVGYFTLRGEPSPIDHERVHHQIQEFVWTKEGRFWSHRQDYLNSEWFNRELHINDSKIEYQAVYEEGYSLLEKPATLRFGVWSDGSTPLMAPKTFLPLEGVWDSSRLTWDLSEFHRKDIDSHGMEIRNGRSCPFIQFTQGRRILFDPEHNCLPCCILQNGVGDCRLCVVEDYREVQPGIWFPAAGYEEVRSTENPKRNGIKRWKVLDVKINQSIPVSAFRIKPVVGTKVEDTFTGFHFTYGRDMPPGTLDSGLNERWVHYVKHGGPHPFPIRRPLTFWQQWRFLFLVLALVLCVGVLAWRTLLPKDVL